MLSCERFSVGSGQSISVSYAATGYGGMPYVSHPALRVHGKPDTNILAVHLANGRCGAEDLRVRRCGRLFLAKHHNIRCPIHFRPCVLFDYLDLVACRSARDDGGSRGVDHAMTVMGAKGESASVAGAETPGQFHFVQTPGRSVGGVQESCNCISPGVGKIVVL